MSTMWEFRIISNSIVEAKPPWIGGRFEVVTNFLSNEVAIKAIEFYKTKLNNKVS